MKRRWRIDRRGLATGWVVLGATIALNVGSATGSMACSVEAATASTKSDVPVFVVGEPETFIRQVPAQGHLEAAEATPITSPPDVMEPMKIAWLAPDGEHVEKDQVVARFDDSSMRLELRDAESSVDAAHTKIAKERIDGALQRQRRDRSAELAEHEAQHARAFDYDDATIFSRTEMLESAIDLELALAKSEHAREVKRIERSVSTGKLDLLDIEHRQAARKVEHAQTGLSHLEVKASHAGLFVLERGWRGEPTKVGDTVWPGQSLAEIPQVSRLRAKLFVLEADAGSVTADLPATLEVEAHPGQVYNGKVEKVAKLATRKNPRVPVQFFEVLVALDTTDPATMSIGQRVRASFEIRDDEALVVPRQAVFEHAGKSVVFRQNGDGFEPVDVTLGPASSGRVIVREGVSPGDALALRDPNRSLDDAKSPTADSADAPTKSEAP